MHSSDSPADQTATYRAIDAGANRAAEGLRVVEDYTRFVLDDAHLTRLAKNMRHRMAETLASIDPLMLHQARDTLGDVGTSISTAPEQQRADTWSICAAAVNRVQQSLRSLEEFSKLLDIDLAAQFESLRYETYTLEQAIDITRTSLARLADARLYVLVDGCESADRFESLVQTLVTAGVHLIQLRDKRLDDRTLLARAKSLTAATRDSRTLSIINDRPDIAALARADGVHVGQEELSVQEARTIVGPRALVGLSTHNIEQARAAVLAGADYIGVGPTFPSATKAFQNFAGLDFVRQVAAEIRLPAFAIGGITQDNIPDVRAAGLHRVAVGHTIAGASNPTDVVAAIASQQK